MNPLAYLPAWGAVRATGARRCLFLGIDRAPMNNIECARYRRALRAQGVEPGDLFKIRDP